MNDNQISDIKTLATRHKMENCEQITDTNGAAGACIRAFYEWADCKHENIRLRKKCERYEAALKKIATPALGCKFQQSVAREALGYD